MKHSLQLLTATLISSMLFSQMPLAAAEDPAPDSFVELELDNKNYEFGQSMEVSLKITNNSDEIIDDEVTCDDMNLLSYKHESEDSFHLLDELNCESALMISLAPGESYDQVFTISPIEAFIPGEWTIKASFGDGGDRAYFTVEDRPYSDIEGHWAEAYIAKLTIKDWLQGYPDGTFMPDQSMSRAEFLELVMNMAPLAVDFPKASFWDVSEEDWFYDSVTQAEALGVIQGYSDGSFRPNEPITRAEALSILLNMMDFVDEASDLEYADVFSDVPDDWTRPYILTAYEMGIVNGVESEDGESQYFLPNANITRGEAAKMVYLGQEMSNLEMETTTHALGDGVLSVDMSFENPADWEVQDWKSNEATFFNKNSNQYEYFGSLVISMPETAIDNSWYYFPLLLEGEPVENYCPILLASEYLSLSKIASCELEKNLNGLDVVHLITYSTSMDGSHIDHSNVYFVDMQNINEELVSKSYIMGLVVSDHGWDGDNYTLNQLVNSVDAYAWGE